MIESNKNETIRNETKIGENKGNSKISEWLKSDDHIKSDEIKSIDNNNYIKYFIIGTTIIIISSLGWIYWEDIKTGTNSLLEWLFSSRPGGSNNPGNSSDSNPTPTRTNFETGSINNSPFSSNIELEDIKGKSILTSPSLEDLNSKAEEAFNSPSSSTSSIETITPTKYEENLINKALNSSNEASSSNIDSLDKYFPNINEIWKKLLPSKIFNQVENIEKSFPIYSKTELDNIINKITNLKIEALDYKNIINEEKNKNNSSILEIKNNEKVYSSLEKWFDEIENKIEKDLADF